METLEVLTNYKKDGDIMQLSSMMNSTNIQARWCPCQGTCGFTCAKQCTGCDVTCTGTCMGKTVNY